MIGALQLPAECAAKGRALGGLFASGERHLLPSFFNLLRHMHAQARAREMAVRPARRAGRAPGRGRRARQGGEGEGSSEERICAVALTSHASHAHPVPGQARPAFPLVEPERATSSRWCEVLAALDAAAAHPQGPQPPSFLTLVAGPRVHAGLSLVRRGRCGGRGGDERVRNGPAPLLPGRARHPTPTLLRLHSDPRLAKSAYTDLACRTAARRVG